MNCRDVDTRIDEYLDGALEASEREALDAHLRTCERCALEAERLRALLAEATALPARISPEHDLWPGIRGEIRRRKVVPLESRAPRAWPRRAALAAAAVALITVSSAITTMLLRSREDPARLAASDAAVLSGIDAWEGAVVQATRELAHALETGRTRLSPETIAVLEENLRVIDDAIRESRAALERDPGNVALGQMLWATYRTKLDLLQRAARWSAES